MWNSSNITLNDITFVMCHNCLSSSEGMKVKYTDANVNMNSPHSLFIPAKKFYRLILEKQSFYSAFTGI